MNFKAGDKVVRVGDDHRGVLNGESYVVESDQTNHFDLYLKGLHGSYAPSQFRLVYGPDTVTDEMIGAFKAGWHLADNEGDKGNRVRRGLENLLAYQSGAQ